MRGSVGAIDTRREIMPAVRTMAALALVVLGAGGCAGNPGDSHAPEAARLPAGGAHPRLATCRPPVGGTLSGRGSAVIDGVMSPGEWVGADSISFDVQVPEGGTAAATLYVMNDD